VNEILLQAGRAAGYVALQEQVIPELMQKRTESGGVQKFREARVDVELFGHPTAPDRILDGTVRHPAAVNTVKKAAIEPGFAAEAGSKEKSKRYPPAHGKCVIGCSMETWGRLGDDIENILVDLHGLAQRRQRDRGVFPTNWILRWRTLLSIHTAMNTGRAIFDSIPSQEKNTIFKLCLSQSGGTDSFVGSGVNENPYPGSGRLNTSTLEASGGQGECCTGGEDRALQVR